MAILSKCINWFHTVRYRNDVVPVVMGAHPDDYRAVAPPSSYIHVDDFETPEHLAKFLLYVAKHDDLYNSYFRWRGTGEFVNTKFWCRYVTPTYDVIAFKISGRGGGWWKNHPQIESPFERS